MSRPPLPPDGYRDGYDPVGRLYGLAGSMVKLADLLNCEDNPLSMLMRVIGEDLENCAAWMDEYMDGGAPPKLPTPEQFATLDAEMNRVDPIAGE